MIVKLLTEHHLEFLSLKEAAQACLSLHLSKCHIVGNHMPRLILYCSLVGTLWIDLVSVKDSYLSLWTLYDVEFSHLTTHQELRGIVRVDKLGYIHV